MFSFGGDVFSFLANVFSFGPNVFSFWPNVFTFEGHVFSFRRRASLGPGVLRAKCPGGRGRWFVGMGSGW